jgi:LysM repeat protein
MRMLLAAVLVGGLFILGLAVVSPTGQIVTPAQAVTASAIPAVPEAAPSPVPPVRLHTVTAGENLTVIAERYGIDLDTLLAANPETDELLHPGDELIILAGRGALHVVAEGDTLWRLARLYGVSAAAISEANCKENDILLEGERLFIPGGRPVRGEASSRATVQRFVWPTTGELSSPYGWRWGRLHSGIDIANDGGTPVRASRAGRVSFAGWWGGYGYAVVIDHGYGLSTLYGHLSDYQVAAGEYVATAQFIGSVGETGNAYGPHLHFEVRREGQTVNPLAFLP